MAADLFTKGTLCFTVALPYKDFTVLDPNATGKPESVYRAPNDARATLRGQILGDANAYGFLAMNQAAFGIRPASTTYPFFGGARTIPTGSYFKMELAANQEVWGLATVGPSSTTGVFASCSVELHPIEVATELPEETDNGGSGAGRYVVGGRPGWRKR